MTFSLIEQDYYEYNLFAFRRNLYANNLKTMRLYWACIWIFFIIFISALCRSYFLLLLLILVLPLQLVIRPIFDKFLSKNIRNNIRAMAQSDSMHFEPRTWELEDEDLKITLSGIILTISYKNILDIVELDKIIVISCRDADRIIPKRAFKTEDQKQKFIQKIKEKIK